ncbi:MAG: hypothetical protein R3F56_14710 [Planctomycetota bacterium]
MPRRDRLTDSVLADLLATAQARWQEFETRRPGYHTYVHADWALAVPALRRLQNTCSTFLECGSGLGVITILADLLGYDAFGIELDPWLFECSQDLAERFGARATWAEGSFVPAGARDDVSYESADFLTVRDGEPAYDDLGMTLADFDLVYAFPWPGEEERFLAMASAHANRDTLVLLYGAADGYQLFRRGRPMRWPDGDAAR